MRRLAHILAAVVILLHGVGDLEKGHSIGWLYLLFGTMAMVLGIFHHRLHARFPRVDAAFHLIEAMMALLIGLNYLHEGKVYLPWVSMAASIPYGALAIKALFGRKGH